MKKEADRELIFRERMELFSILVSIRKNTTDEKVKTIIKTYFNSKYGLYAEVKEQIPYYYTIISPDLFDKLSLIPEDIINHEDAIEFLIKFYYEHANLSNAQKTLTQEDALQTIIEDSKNAISKTK